MNIKVQTKARSYDDVLNCWSHWTIKWMDFVSDCPDLLNIRWFYESENISEMMAIEMRKLISVWMMLYGSDIVRVILSVVDFPIAKACRLNLLADHAMDENMSMSGWLSILQNVSDFDFIDLDHNQRFNRLVEMMTPIKHPFFDTALIVFQRRST